MDKNSNRAWWSAMGFGKSPDIHEADFADMGTAFGLDASMGPADDFSADVPSVGERPARSFSERLNGRSVL